MVQTAPTVMRQCRSKAFQKVNRLTPDGIIVGKKALAKIAELIKILEKPKEEDLPAVASLGDKY